MTASDSLSPPPITNPFLFHLVALLSVYELGPNSAPPPRYDGLSDWQTDSIIRSLAAVAKRMYHAEEQLVWVTAQKERHRPHADSSSNETSSDTPSTPAVNSLIPYDRSHTTTEVASVEPYPHPHPTQFKPNPSLNLGPPPSGSYYRLHTIAHRTLLLLLLCLRTTLRA